MISPRFNIFGNYDSQEKLAEDLELLASYLKEDAGNDPERGLWIVNGIELTINKTENESGKYDR